MAIPSRAQVLAELTGRGGPFEIWEAEVAGRRMRTYRNAPVSLGAVLELSRAHGDRDHLVYGDERVSFAEHLGLVTGVARWLAAERGIGKGDRVAIALRNHPEWPVAFWATQVLGAVAIPLNAWWSGPELRFALEDSGVALAVVDGERLDRMSPDLRELRLPAVVVRHEGPLDAEAAHWHDVLQVIDRSGDLPLAEVGPDDLSTILYTSGTTGEPKGAVHTHRNHITNYLNTALTGVLEARLAVATPRSPTTSPRPQPCSLQTYPFFHIGGLTTVLTSVGFGTKVVLMYKWELEEALELIQRERVTSLAAVPTLLRQLFDSPRRDQYDLSSLGTLASGGAPVPPDLVGRVDTLFERKAAASNGYGLTETSSAVTINRGSDYLARPTSVGRPFPVVDVRVVDAETGADQPRGDIGELWFFGPSIVTGYWNKPESTAAAFTDGWFRTGDVGYVDDDGFVYVVDRLKDVVIRGGENVYCAEVEAALFEHPAVGDVAVIGLPHRELGEQVVAVVQLKEGTSVDPADLQEHARTRLAYFKVPEQVVLRGEPLPRTATGKVLKRDLRNELTP